MSQTNRNQPPKPHETKPKLTKKQSQWAWFVGLYLAGLLTILTIAKLIKWAMGI